VNPPPVTRLLNETDIVLVAAAQRGERDAMNALLERHYDRIASTCKRIICDQADAADATQEACVAIAKGIGRFDGTSSFTTWAYRVATNAALDELRRKGRRPVPNDDVALLGDLGANPRGGTPTPFADIDSTTDLGRALAKIPAEYRAPLVLRDVSGLDYAEIAEILGIPGGTVRSRIARARAALAPLLRINGGEAAPVSGTSPNSGASPVSGNQTPDSQRPRFDHVD
jgi:RNA polymerase sigma-70 factor, ECF subfamily